MWYDRAYTGRSGINRRVCAHNFDICEYEGYFLIARRIRLDEDDQERARYRTMDSNISRKSVSG